MVKKSVSKKATSKKTAKKTATHTKKASKKTASKKATKKESTSKTATKTEVAKEKVESKENAKKQINKGLVWKIIAAVLGLILIILLIVNSTNTSIFEGKNGNEKGLVDSQGNPIVETTFKGEKVKLNFYVMSQCPYGTQVMDAIAPVTKDFGAILDFDVDYISTDLGNGQFKSLHGQPETDGNIVQLCAKKYEPLKYMDMIVCQDKDMRAIPGNWEECAIEAELDVESIKTCFEGDEGIKLLQNSSKNAMEANAQGSPTIYLNGKKYQGGRSEIDFKRAICSEIDYKADACKKVPKPVEVGLTIINDELCVACDTSGIVGATKQYFPGLTEATVIDYEDKKAKELMEKYNIKFLPAFIFSSELENTETWKTNTQLQAAFMQVEEGYMILPQAIGAFHDPMAENCENGKDDRDQDGLVDCADDECSGAMVCREEQEKNLKVFIMSDCPYGRKAVEALKEVDNNFGDAITFDIHYIAAETENGFNSLHGQYEVDENIIQLCTKQKSPEVWFDYMYCRSTKGVRGIDWKDCANEVGVDVTAVEACFNGDEGSSLLREDIKIANSLGIGASPTWLANNKYLFQGIDAETVKQNLCNYNEGLAGCDNTLDTSAAAGVPTGACG